MEHDGRLRRPQLIPEALDGRTEVNTMRSKLTNGAALVCLALAVGACAHSRSSVEATPASLEPVRGLSSAAPPEPKVGVLATEVRSRAADGSVEEGDLIESGLYEAVLHRIAADLGSCTQGQTEPTVIVDVQPSGSVGAIENVKDVPSCLAALVKPLKFPPRQYAVSLLIVVTPSGQ
jgi:hypothetical protein